MLSNEIIFKIAEEAGFVLWGDEKWNHNKSVVDWSSEYDEELVKFARLIEQHTNIKRLEK